MAKAKGDTLTFKISNLAEAEAAEEALRLRKADILREMLADENFRWSDIKEALGVESIGAARRACRKLDLLPPIQPREAKAATKKATKPKSEAKKSASKKPGRKAAVAASAKSRVNVRGAA